VLEELIAEIVELLKQDSLFSIPPSLSNINLTDKDDMIIVSSPLNGKADFFITGDRELLELREV
jgi:predicted nucleic acid-binding protein